MDRVVVSILAVIGIGQPPPGLPGNGSYVLPPSGQWPIPWAPGCNGSKPILPPWKPGCNGTLPALPPWLPIWPPLWRPPCPTPPPLDPGHNSTTAEPPTTGPNNNETTSSSPGTTITTPIPTGSSGPPINNETTITTWGPTSSGPTTESSSEPNTTLDPSSTETTTDSSSNKPITDQPTKPTEPSTESPEPSTDPSEPTTSNPTEPSTGSSDPTTEQSSGSPTETTNEPPTEPTTNPTVNPSEPSTESDQPTKPSTELTTESLETTTNPSEPSTEPSENSTTNPSDPTTEPTSEPSVTPTNPSDPSPGQTTDPSEPSTGPTTVPTGTPTVPWQPSTEQTTDPTEPSTGSPTIPSEPSTGPTTVPTGTPTNPTEPSTGSPTNPSEPSTGPTTVPTGTPTGTWQPSTEQTTDPTEPSTESPTNPSEPSTGPTTVPTGTPTGTWQPSTEQTTDPTEPSTGSPTNPSEPSTGPTIVPTGTPTGTWQPSTEQTTDPTEPSTGSPTNPSEPSTGPTTVPTGTPTGTWQPSTEQTTDPTEPTTGSPTNPSEPSTGPTTETPTETTSSTTSSESTTPEATTTPEEEGASASLPFDDPHFIPKRSGIVHLHEWKFLDIAKECEDFLGPKGYAAVQTSPVNENLIIAGRPWYERYQPMSYEVRTRSGEAKDFLEMTRRCLKAGIRIYVDVVPNHMTANAPAPAKGTGGSIADPNRFFYPAVPYNVSHFNQPTCQITDFNDPEQARVCELVSLHDLNQTIPHVQIVIANFLNYLTALGAAGFRVDAAKHIYPEQLKKIYSRLSPLSEQLRFAADSYPFIYQEVGDSWKFNYTDLGAVTEFSHATNMAAFFKNQLKASALQDYGGAHMGMLPSRSALVFVDNHDLQRQNPFTLNYKSPREYRAAYAFTLAHPYGIPRVMSSFDFKTDQDGPPHDKSYNIKSPTFDSSGQCRSGWVCEHRWPAIANMIVFRNEVGDSPLENFWSNDEKGVIAFNRGKKGFLIVSSGAKSFNERVQTNLPPGVYCDSMSQKRVTTKCESSSRVVVRYDGTAAIELPRRGKELAVALHTGNLIKASVYDEDPQ